jgi:DHA2 family multidrug resistance protein-like MFS transporter
MAQHPSMVTLVIGTVIYSLGLCPIFILATDLIVGSAPVERAGAASAISETSSELGGALGIAVLGSIGTAVYRSRMADALPFALPAVSLTAAQSTLGGALAEAGKLPEETGARLLGSARDAFVHAFGMAALISAGIALATAVLVLVLIHPVRSHRNHPR